LHLQQLLLLQQQSGTSPQSRCMLPMMQKEVADVDDAHQDSRRKSVEVVRFRH
jgi:hypothetical protein